MANTTLGLIVWLAMAVAYGGAVRRLVRGRTSYERTRGAAASRLVADDVVGDELAPRRARRGRRRLPRARSATSSPVRAITGS